MREEVSSGDSGAAETVRVDVAAGFGDRGRCGARAGKATAIWVDMAAFLGLVACQAAPGAADEVEDQEGDGLAGPGVLPPRTGSGPGRGGEGGE